MGGKSSDNSDMINLEKQQAEEARRKEAERQARIQQGLDAIKGAFEGTDQYKTVAGKDFTVGAPGAGVKIGDAVSGGDLPTGYTYVQINPSTGTPNVPGTVNPTTYGSPGASGNYRQSGPAGVGGTSYTGGEGGGGTGSVKGKMTGAELYAAQQQAAGAAAGANTDWAIKGPDGKIYKIGDVIGTTKQEKTGHSGGFDDNFYNKWRNAMTTYYAPQITDQYKQASDELTYRLARAGLLNSTVANEQRIDLQTQDERNAQAMRDKADKGVGDLKKNIADQRTAITNQLFASEDPNVAANAATAAVTNISPAPTDLSPLADVFNVAAIGGAGALNQYNNQRYRAQVPGFNNPGATRII